MGRRLCRPLGGFYGRLPAGRPRRRLMAARGCSKCGSSRVSGVLSTIRGRLSAARFLAVTSPAIGQQISAGRPSKRAIILTATRTPKWSKLSRAHLWNPPFSFTSNEVKTNLVDGIIQLATLRNRRRACLPTPEICSKLSSNTVTACCTTGSSRYRKETLSTVSGATVCSEPRCEKVSTKLSTWPIDFLDKIATSSGRGQARYKSEQTNRASHLRTSHKCAQTLPSAQA